MDIIENKLVTLEELKIMGKGEIVPIPPFIGVEPICVRLRKVGLLNLIATGSIPNSLFSAAEELFSGKSSSKGNVDISQLSKVMKTVSESALVQPTLEELKEVGLELSDEQAVAIFNYTQRGINALIPSDKKRKDSIDTGNK